MLNEYELQVKHELFDHQIPYLIKANQEINLEGKAILEVGGSLPENLVINDVKAKQWIAIEDIAYWDEISAKLTVDKLSKIENSAYSNKKKYEVLAGKIENLPESYFQKFDAIISIATFEHIAKLPEALDVMYKALKPGGKLFSLFSPIWSAHDGHHLTDVYDEMGNMYYFRNSPIPPWGHLLMSPMELYDHITKTHSRNFANKIVYYVYNSNHINRFMYEDYIETIDRSFFSKKIIIPAFESDLPEGTHEKLIRKFGKRNFSSNGMMVILER